MKLIMIQTIEAILNIIISRKKMYLPLLFHYALNILILFYNVMIRFLSC